MALCTPLAAILRARRWPSVVGFALVAASLLLPGAFDPSGGSGVAYAEKKEKRPPPPARLVQTVGDRERRWLTDAQEALAKGDYEAAEAALGKLQTHEKRNDYETALMHQLYGHLHSERGEYKRAIRSFEGAVATKALPRQADLNLRYNLGQLYVATERYKEAIRILKDWLKRAENPAPRGYVLVAQAYVSLGDYRKALPPIRAAIRKSKKPEESWLRLALIVRLELEQYAEAAEVLELLCANYSNKTYWTQLSGVYGNLGRDKAALNAMEVAYRQGFLTESEELVRMAELYLYNGVPYQAALVVEKGLADGSIEKNLDGWRLLANSWLSAKEFDRALAPLERAASLSSEGELSLRLGHLHLHREEWSDAAKALRGALRKGGIDKPASAQLLLGIALYQLGDTKGAEQAFRRAAAADSTRASAEQWLAHMRGQG